MCDAPYSAHAVARPGPARRRECTGPAGASRTCPRPSPTTRTLHKFTSHHTHSPGHRRSARHTSRRRSMPAGEERRAGRRRVAWPHRHGPTALSLSLPGRKIVGPPPPGRAEYGAGRRKLPPGAAQPAQGAQGDAPRRASAQTEAFGRRGLVMQHLLPLGLRGDERPRRRRGSGQAHGVVAGTDWLSARTVSISSAWATAELRRRPSAPLGSSGRFENSQIVRNYCD